MTSRDMDFLARKIVSLERKHDTLARAKQLPNSSVQLVDGTDVGISDGAEVAQDAHLGLDSLYEHSDEIGDNVDEEAINVTIIPHWVREVDYNIGASWDAAQQANDRVIEAQAEADQASADALAASQAAAAAQKRVDDITSQLENKLINPGFEEGVTGWVRPAGSITDTVPIDPEYILEGEGRFGSHALSFGAPTFPSVISAHRVNAGEGSIFRGGLWYKGEPGTDGETRIELITYAEDGTFALPFASAAIPAGAVTDWTYFQTSMEVTNPNAAYIVMAVGRYNSDADLLLDDLELLDVTEAAQALADAEAAKYLAEGIYTTIPSVTEPTTRANGSPLVQGDLWYKVGVDENADKFIGVGVWNGTEWQDRQLVADSILVPGTVGPVLIEDGAITGQKIAADAIDGKTITGAHITGGILEQVTQTHELGSFVEPVTADSNEWLGHGATLSTTVPAGVESTRSAYTYAMGEIPAIVSALLPAQYTGGMVRVSVLVRHDQTIPVSVDCGPLFGEPVTVPANTWTRVYGPTVPVTVTPDVDIWVRTEAQTLWVTEPIIEVVEQRTLQAIIGSADGSPGMSFWVDDNYAGGVSPSNVTTQTAQGRPGLPAVDEVSQSRLSPDTLVFRNWLQDPVTKEVVSEGSAEAVIHSVGELWLVANRIHLNGPAEFSEPITIGNYSDVETSVKLVRERAGNINEVKLYNAASDNGQAGLIVSQNDASMARIYVGHDGVAGVQTYAASPTANGSRPFPFAVASGLWNTQANINNGAGRTGSVTFPSGRFTRTPNIMAVPGGSARLNIAVIRSSSSTSGTSIRLDNWSGAAASPDGVEWLAIQMTPTNSNG